jgi:hypothetical protein
MLDEVGALHDERSWQLLLPVLLVPIARLAMEANGAAEGMNLRVGSTE